MAPVVCGAYRLCAPVRSFDDQSRVSESSQSAESSLTSAMGWEADEQLLADHAGYAVIQSVFTSSPIASSIQVRVSDNSSLDKA